MDAVAQKTHLKVAIENSDYVDGRERFFADIDLEDLVVVHDLFCRVTDGDRDEVEQRAADRIGSLIEAIKSRG